MVGPSVGVCVRVEEGEGGKHLMNYASYVGLTVLYRYYMASRQLPCEMY